MADRITQHAVDIAAAGAPNARITQHAVDVAAAGSPKARITQHAVDVVSTVPGVYGDAVTCSLRITGAVTPGLIIQPAVPIALNLTGAVTPGLIIQAPVPIALNLTVAVLGTIGMVEPPCITGDGTYTSGPGPTIDASFAY